MHVLHPFEVGRDHAACVAQDVGNDKNFVAPLIKHFIGLGCGRTVGRFGQHAAAQQGGVARVDDALHGRRHQNIARQGEKIIGRDSLALRKIFQCFMLLHVTVGGGNIETVRVVKADRVIAQSGNFHARLVGQPAGGDRSDIAEALHDGGALGRLDVEMIQRPLDEKHHPASG